jgi:hypothetical protein
MAKYLVTFNDQINGIEISGLRVMTLSEVNRFEELANSIEWEFTYNLSGEILEYYNGEDFLSRIDYKEITNDEASVIKKLFNDSFGFFIDEAYLEGILDEDEDDEDDDTDDYSYDEDEDEDY